ncbi:hypothetical protein NDU88_003042 [Pleurodeles waltl]|uniref:Uncharacterized protein n=1 Tax=Pleurodeles waltl TaxID=8319 RepID=A0AAV7TMA7_PLEWA|nr:hypothetical protein NDU88_003042 [Pleurodeles waltl]
MSPRLGCAETPGVPRRQPISCPRLGTTCAGCATLRSRPDTRGEAFLPRQSAPVRAATGPDVAAQGRGEEARRQSKTDAVLRGTREVLVVTLACAVPGI